MTEHPTYRAPSETSDAVLHKIKQQRLVPRPRWQFLVLNIGIWLCGIGGVIAGAIAVCMIIVITQDAELSLLAASKRAPTLLILRSLPMLWGVCMIACIVLAEYFFRHTERGYKTPLGYLTVVIVALSVFIGGGLYILGAGDRVFEYIDSRHAPLRGVLLPHHTVWEAPGNGLLRGRIEQVVSSDELRVSDHRGEVWNVRLDQAVIDGEPKVSRHIFALGEASDQNVFYAQRILVIDEQTHPRLPGRGQMMPPR